MKLKILLKMRNPFKIKYYIMSVNTYNWYTRFKSYLTSYHTHKLSDFIPNIVNATCWHYDSSLKKLIDTKEEAERVLKDFVNTNKEDHPITKWYIKKKLCWVGFKNEED